MTASSATAVVGECDPRLRPVRDLLTRRLAVGDEVGASLCVMSGDDVLVDLWGGVADPASGRAWERDTLASTYSLTKTMTALAVLVLVDRGLLDLDAPVARYWPEFAAAGKDEVLVRHVLGHTSGVSGWDRRMRIEDLYRQGEAAALLAQQAPWWRPGDGSGYHALTFGTVLAEVVGRVTGRTLGEFVAAEIADPLGADYRIGVTGADPTRFASMIAPPPTGFDYGSLPPDSILLRTLLNPAFVPSVTADRDFLAAELGAVNGQGNARSVALMQSIVTGGGTARGRRFLSADTVERIFDVQADGVDRVLGAPVRFGLGWALPGPSMPGVPDGRVCWWTGFGGSIVVSDLDRGITIGYVMNKMAPQLIGAPNPNDYVAAVYDCLDR